MTYTFIKLKRWVNGKWLLTYSENNVYPKEMEMDDSLAQIILSAQRAGRNELRRKINEALKMERLDGRNPV